MKIQRSTLILIVSALLLGGFVYYYEIQGTPRRELAKAKQQQIFSFKAEEVQSITVTTKAQTLIFERSGGDKAQSPPPEPSWLMKVVEAPQQSKQAPTNCQQSEAGKTPASCQPPATGQQLTASPSPIAEATPALVPSPTTSPLPATGKPQETKPSQAVSAKTMMASEGSVAYLLNLLIAGKSERAIVMTEPARQRQEFGLDDPKATLEVKLKNQTTHRLILGKPDFNRSFLYAQADPPMDSDALEVLLVSTDFENAVDRPLSQWKKEDLSSDKKSQDTSKNKESQNTSKDKESQGTSKGSEGSANPSAPKDSQ